MTKIGMIGMGKLGSAVAKTLNYKGYNVYGYDVTPADQRVKEKESDTIGGDLWKLETTGKLYEQDSIEGVILQSDIIFVTIQTPHEKEFEGTTRIPEERRDFNYSYLIKGMTHINEVVQDLGKEKVVVIISTVLPGTIRDCIIPELSPLVKLAYSPQFIAMGTVMKDFLFPEFVLLGTIDPVGTKALKDFYEEFYNNLTPILEMRLESAELAKVAYNTYIGMKIVFANTMMEICEATDADVDEVMGAIKKAKNRLISPAYLDAGMGDGGGCHPRDNIAMSWLAKEHGISHNIFEDIMKAREDQAEFIANTIHAYATSMPTYPVVLLGKAFKPETKITTGSPALLVANILKEKNVKFEHYDYMIDGTHVEPKRAIFCILTKHYYYQSFNVGSWSIIIDPFGYHQNLNEDTWTIKLGRKS
jgi:UDPglucose 6-dehydrogenase